MDLEFKKALELSYGIFKPWSDIYQWEKKRFLRSLELLARFGGDFRGKKIVDLGSGIGITLKALNLLGAGAVGVDKLVFSSEPSSIYSVKDFEKLEKIWKENDLKVFKADLAFDKLPFGDESLDAAICDSAIEHLPVAPKHLFSEVGRILKPDGIFLVTTPNIASFWKRMRFLLLGRSPNWDLKDYFENWNNFRGHSREFTKKELSDMLAWSDFEILLAETRNVFRNEERLFSKSPQKAVSQIFEFLSLPFPNMRDTVYIVVTPRK